jgi:hypothetical protein
MNWMSAIVHVGSRFAVLHKQVYQLLLLQSVGPNVHSNDTSSQLHIGTI